MFNLIILTRSAWYQKFHPHVDQAADLITLLLTIAIRSYGLIEILIRTHFCKPNEKFYRQYLVLIYPVYQMKLVPMISLRALTGTSEIFFFVVVVYLFFDVTFRLVIVPINWLCLCQFQQYYMPDLRTESPSLKIVFHPFMSHMIARPD